MLVITLSLLPRLRIRRPPSRHGPQNSHLLSNSSLQECGFGYGEDAQCEVPAAQVQGGLGLSEVQAMPGLRPADCLEGQLFLPPGRRVCGDCLPGYVGQSSPGDQVVILEQDFLSGSLFQTRMPADIHLLRSKVARVHCFSVSWASADASFCMVTGGGLGSNRIRQ